MSTPALPHLNPAGEARMVDVSAKQVTARTASAGAFVRLAAVAVAALRDQTVPKGDALAVARIAGIQGAKRTSELIPLCHPLMLSQVAVELTPAPPDAVEIEATAKLAGQTGVEMEAMTATMGAALTVYDMLKAVDKGMVIGGVRLLEKVGGKSGHWKREE